MIEWEFFQFISFGAFGVGAFLFKLLFQRIDSNARMMIELHAKQSATHEQIVSLFRSVDKLESKMDEWMKASR